MADDERWFSACVARASRRKPETTQRAAARAIGSQRFGAASKAANYITDLHFENTLAAAASIRDEQVAGTFSASTRSGQVSARAAAPLRAGQGAAVKVKSS
jgi:hypothetical protein